MSGPAGTDRMLSPDRTCLRAMLAVENPPPADACLDAILAAIDGRRARLTVAAVPSRLHVLTKWAPLAGYDVSQLPHEALREASCAAQRIVDLVSEDIAVEHRTAPSWRRLLDIVLEESFDVLYVAGAPSSLRDRRALRRAELCGEARIVTVSSWRRPAA